MWIETNILHSPAEGETERRPFIYSMTHVHLGPGEALAPIDCVHEARRALRRGASDRDVCLGAREAIGLMRLATELAAARGNWGARPQQLRRILLRLKKAASACTRIADEECTEIILFSDAVDATLALLAEPHAG